MSDAAAVTPLEDGGTSACRVLYGPAELAFRGPAALIASAHELRMVANDVGKPRVFSLPVMPPSAPAVTPPRPTSFVGVRWPPCEVAGRFAYCPGGGGVVYRTTIGGSDTKAVAKHRPGTRIAAAPIGKDHAVVATLDTRHTSEGEMLQAFITLDDGETSRLSEEGAGATSVRLTPRGEGVIASYLDTRTAMVPVHARPIGLRGGELLLGEDAVLLVGGAPERGVDFAVSASGNRMSLLLPQSKETIDFGMAVIPVHDPPKDDVPATWSMYPNGLDPAPVGATVGGDGDPRWVARVVPVSGEPGAPRVLELGRIDEAGAFQSLGSVADAAHITDVSMVTDPHGAIWILYGDASVTHLQRRLCRDGRSK